MLAALQRKVDAVAEEVRSKLPTYPHCGQPGGDWGASRYSPGYMAGTLGKLADLSLPLPLLRL